MLGQILSGFVLSDPVAYRDICLVLPLLIVSIGFIWTGISACEVQKLCKEVKL